METIKKNRFRIVTIVAVSKDFIIGDGNQMLWHLPNDLKRQEKINSVYEFIDNNKEKLCENIQQCQITLGSDGFFPFPDNTVEASKYGVNRILQPGGSIMDPSVNDKCRELNISMINIGTRMFYH